MSEGAATNGPLVRAREWMMHRSREVQKPEPKKDTLNSRIALAITNAVGTMWCAYAFTLLALISLPQAIAGGIAPLIAWIAQTFLQLVLLSIIMVGQKVAARASDAQAYQTYMDAEAILHLNDQMHRLIEENNKLTSEIHRAVKAKK